MNKIFALTAIATGLLAAPAAFAIQPNAAPEVGSLENAPAGSTVMIKDKDQFGSAYQNVFRVSQDGSLQLVNQFRIGD